MKAPILRPRARQLLFQLYGRPLHPELFEILAETRAYHENYEIVVRLTRCGHVISWENPDVFLTEVVTSEELSLPRKRRLLSQRLRFEQCRSVLCAHNVHYQTSFQVETLEPELFLEEHHALLKDGHQRGLLHCFSDENAPGLSALSLTDVQAMPGCVFLLGFHTFPEECTIVKTQSLIEIEK